MPDQLPAAMQAIIAREPGDATVLMLSERPVPTPGAGQVLLRVCAAGVNRPDIMQREGQAVPAPGITDILGLEACGTVVACGAGVPASWMGRRMMALLPGGGYAPWCLAAIDHCLPVPDSLSDDAAGALPEGLFTVWHNLFELGGLQMGQTVLIHGGAGGIGTLAISMAKAAGATVITTAGQPERLGTLRDLGADLALCYRSEDFVQASLDFTQGRGVDIVLDMVGGDYLRRNLQAMAFGGRHVSLSFMQGSSVTVELLTLMQKQLSLHASTMRPQSHQEKARMAIALTAHVLPLLANGTIRPRIHAALPLAQAAAAHTQLESGQVFGKIVLHP
ncbi:NAD(P)H-quinone oxidoreductase [Pseudomonas sp. S 311-6]|nr:NAD(P)H-quinone oxidoreductase [Pseudomonas sp. S 311-6]